MNSSEKNSSESDISFAIKHYNKGNYSSDDPEEAKRTLEAIVALRGHPVLLKEVEADDK